MTNRHRIQFPPQSSELLDQDETYFHLLEGDRKHRLRFHDYGEIYRRPGLYEQMFYERLRCSSPKKVADILKHTVAKTDKQFSEMRILDLGAGNGMMAEELERFGVARLVGVDIIPEARDAAERDRPGLYDAYYVTDMSDLPADVETELEEWSIHCLTSVAALGFGDIPPGAFLKALSFVPEGGWAAFNIKETFLEASDTSGFSRFIRNLILSSYVEIYHMEKYRHRLSMEGTPLFYFAIVLRKNADLPDDFLSRHGISD